MKDIEPNMNLNNINKMNRVGHQTFTFSLLLSQRASQRTCLKGQQYPFIVQNIFF